MRPLIYATFITLVLAVAGVVQATVINQLDGKSLLCKNKSNQTNPYFGLIFDAGKVNTWIVVGHLKKRKNQKIYYLRGTSEVFWEVAYRTEIVLNRETLKVGGDQCEISSKKGIFQKLDEIIVEVKKRNKI